MLLENISLCLEFRNITLQENMGYLIRQHIMCKQTNLCKLGNYQSGPLDADPMDGVRGLSTKKDDGWGLKRKKIPPLTPFIGSASSGPD